MLINPKVYYQELDAPTKDVLGLYKTDNACEDAPVFSAYLNLWLRDNKTLNANWKDRIQLLDQAIAGNHCIEDRILYRATSSHIIDKFIRGEVVEYPAYMSTSLKISTPAKILRSHDHDWALLKITCPNGTNMMAMEGNPEWGEDESEFLLGRNTIFTMNSMMSLESKSDIQAELSPCSIHGILQLVVYDLTVKIN